VLCLSKKGHGARRYSFATKKAVLENIVGVCATSNRIELDVSIAIIAQIVAAYKASKQAIQYEELLSSTIFKLYPLLGRCIFSVFVC